MPYTNWRGEHADRTIAPIRMFWGSTEWHPEPQWLIEAWDAEKQATRIFALSGFGPPTPALAPQNGGLRAAAQAALKAIDDIIAESAGVAGLHLNGDVAPWGDLTEGGRFEDWLRPIELLRTALAAPAEPDATPAQPVSAAGSDAKLKKRPVAFRVNDPEYGCVLYLDEEAADRHAEIVSVQAQGLYVRDGTPVVFDDATPTPALAPQDGGLRAADKAVADDLISNAYTILDVLAVLAALSEPNVLPGLKLALEMLEARVNEPSLDVILYTVMGWLRSEIARREAKS